MRWIFKQRTSPFIICRCFPIHHVSCHTESFSDTRGKQKIDQFQELGEFQAWETAVKQFEATREKKSDLQILQNINWGLDLKLSVAMLVLIPKV